ncbi:MAG: hypothetical protein HZA37_00250 [Parcubacteria group bacterium]|nr:hypothetical protein [Parcubacteria group bacterium]
MSHVMIMTYAAKKIIVHFGVGTAGVRTGGTAVLLAAILLSPLFSPAAVKAQTAPSVIAAWKADSYAPANFSGKILPSKSSVVTASVEILDNGRFVNLSGTEIRWLLDNGDIVSGAGKKTFQFRVGKEAEDAHELKITVLYRGAELIGFLTIPVTAPEAVIDFRGYRYQIRQGESRFRVLPYFFNITEPKKDLKFVWSSGDQTAEGTDENPDELVYGISSDTPIGDTINIRVLAQNIRKELEFAGDSLTLVVIK